MKRLALLTLGIALAACGGETEPTPSAAAYVPPAPPAPEAFAPADSLGFVAEADSLALDSLAVNDSAAVTEAPPPAPSFAPFLARFKQALQTGDAAPFAAEGVDLGPLADDPAFRQRVLAAPPDRYRREGTRREVWVVVGYDMEGNVVPEDEAETESGLGLVFDVVDGAYRLVSLNAAG